MNNFDLPPRDGLSDAEYIPCLEHALRLMADIIANNEARLQAADSMLKALVLTSPNHRVVITPDHVRKAQAVDLAYDQQNGDYVLYARIKETKHAH